MVSIVRRSTDFCFPWRRQRFWVIDGLFGLSLLVIRALCHCTGLYVVPGVALFCGTFCRRLARHWVVFLRSKNRCGRLFRCFLIKRSVRRNRIDAASAADNASQRAADALAAAMAAKRRSGKRQSLDCLRWMFPYAPQMGPRSSADYPDQIGDFGCPHCRKTVGVVDELLKAYPGKSIFSQLPLDEIRSAGERKIHERLSRGAGLVSESQQGTGSAKKKTLPRTGER